MKKERGGIILFLLLMFFVAVLIVGGALFYKKGFFLGFRLPFQSAGGIQSDGNLIDVAKPPQEQYLPDFIRHCNETPNYHWSGSSCAHN